LFMKRKKMMKIMAQAPDIHMELADTHIN
jgi:hypothetical protein